MTLTDGSVWLVKRERKVTFSDKFIPQPPKLSFEHDADKVWAELDWCGGSHGNIQLGANPQQAGNAAIKAIEDTIRNGGTASEALDAASKTERHAVPQLRHRPVALVERVGQGRG